MLSLCTKAVESVFPQANSHGCPYGTWHVTSCIIILVKWKWYGTGWCVKWCSCCPNRLILQHLCFSLLYFAHPPFSNHRRVTAIFSCPAWIFSWMFIKLYCLFTIFQLHVFNARSLSWLISFKLYQRQKHTLSSPLWANNSGVPETSSTNEPGCVLPGCTDRCV